MPASTAAWPRASKKNVLPVPDGPHTTRFSRRRTHSRVRRALWVGAGIKEALGSQADEVKEITQPFRRIGAERTGSDKGAGMGLAIVSSVVEVHGGTLDLEALSDGGLRVAIILPLTVRRVAGAPA